MDGNLVPIVIEKTGRGERAYDIYSRLLKDRIIFIGPVIDDYTSSLVIAQILFLMSENKNQDINIYLNTPGGSVTSGLAIYDTMQFVPCDIATYCIGQAASMGAILLCAGTKGKRHALPNSRIMIHQPSGGTSVNVPHVHTDNACVQACTQHEPSFALLPCLPACLLILIDILARHTEKPVEQIEDDSDRDFFLSPTQAQEYGLVDEVIESLRGDQKDE